MPLTFKEYDGYKYTEELPKRVSMVTFRTGVELLRLKKGKRVWTTGNVEPREGLPLFIYSPYSQWYWYRELGGDHHLAEYRKFIKDNNLFIYWDEHWQEVVTEEREQEKMSYRDYNNIRELILLKEYHESLSDRTELQSKLRAIEIQKNLILDKYTTN